MNYTPEMFDITKVEELNKELIMQKETIEFQLRVYEGEFDKFKQTNYPELLIYERKKKIESTLPPDAIILNQLKVLSNDESSVEFNKVITSLNNELQDIDFKIKRLYMRFDCLFSFTSINLSSYLRWLDLYFSDSYSFDTMMVSIFNNEFLDSNIYNYIKDTNNVDTLELIFKKIPVDWKDIGRVLVDEVKYLLDSNVDKGNTAILEKRENRKRIVKNKILIQNRKMIEPDLSDLRDDLFSKNINFTSLRAERHKVILDAAENSAIFNKRAGNTPKASQTLRNLRNK